MVKRRVVEPGALIAQVQNRADELFSREHQMRETDRQMDGVFERLYFHEIDGREKVVQRLQLPLVTFIALFGMLGHIIQNAQRTIIGNAGWLWLLVALAAAFLLVAAVFFIISVIGHTYSFIPVPREWQDYRDQCQRLYEGEVDSDRLVAAAVTKGLVARYAECATINGHINEKKSFYVFMILRFLVAAAVFAVAAYAVFFFAELGSTSTYKVEIVNPLTPRGTEMTSHKPPPPPPPPPSRQVRDDRRPPTPPQPRPTSP